MAARGFLRSVVAGIILLSVLVAPVVGADWPTYRYDAARSGASPEQLKTPLHLQWVYVPRHAPRPAWPEPGRMLNRMAFDYAYQVAVANGLVYFGSSADHKVYALDLTTGQERWSFFTEAPIRFAPTVTGERVFVASDDGWLYCLSAAKGSLLWKFYAGPRDERLMGNEQMISRWPLRSGVVVQDGIVYFTAGMWPAEGVYVYALRATDGAVIWKNDTSGQMYLPQPHPGSAAMTGVAPQGYIVAYKDKLFVPTGRNVPAAFDRNTGRFLYYRSQPNSWHDRWGGSWAFAAVGLLFNWENHTGPDINIKLGESEPWPGDGLIAFDCQTGKVKWGIEEHEPLLRKHCAVVKANILYASGNGKVSAFDLKTLLAGSKPADAMKWEAPHQRAYALIVAGETVVVGGQDTVTTIAASDGDILGTSPVDGQARGLAVADGRLVVSMSTGQIACFGPEEIPHPPTISPQVRREGLRLASAVTARRIIDQTGITAGYCLLLGAGDGSLSYELAKRSDLRIYCIEPDPQKVAAVRRALDMAGRYGVQVTVHQGSLSELAYPDYFANLIVLDERLGADFRNCSARELYRVLRPCGGTAYIGAMPGTGSAWQPQVGQWLGKGGVPAAEIRASETGVQVVRGELPGAGEWTHQYADAGRSGSSEDQLVKLPLKLLWFGKPGPAHLINRHWRAPAPLSINGRLFIAGQQTVIAVDAYNGCELWTRDIPNAGRLHSDAWGSNFAADYDSVYIATGDVCLRLDAKTGETKQTYHLPPPPELAESMTSWAYLAQQDDLVLGSMGSRVAEGPVVFALGKDDGELRWMYAAQEVVSNHAIAVGADRVYLLDRTSAHKIEQMKRRGEGISIECTLLALDAASGEIIWQTTRHVTQRTALWLSRDVVGAVTMAGGAMTGYSASDGEMLWVRDDVGMSRLPVIVGDTIYGQPYAYDLLTGESKQRTHPLTGEQIPWSFARCYGCGAVAGAPSMLLFRSGTVGFCDLAGDSGIHNFGGVRAGCHINAIAANGLVLMPPGDAGCTCSYNYQTTVALVPTPRNEEWSVFSAEGGKPGAKIRRLAVNFGAPGDQRDADGKLWLGFPRPSGLGVPLETQLSTPDGYYRRNADEMIIRGTNSPWLYTSGCAGLQTATVTLRSAEPTSYTVRLHFAELEDVEPSQRVFDVKLQDEVVLAGLDIVKEAGGPNIAVVKEFLNLPAEDTIKLELVPHTDREPIISAMEIYEE